MQFFSVKVELSLNTLPPDVLQLPENEQLVKVAAEKEMNIPPPPGALLPEKIQFVT